MDISAMKKLLLALALILAPTFASAQCNGVFSAGTICGVGTAESPKPPHQITAASVVTFPLSVRVQRVPPLPTTYGTATWGTYTPTGTLLCSGANGSAGLTTCLASAVNLAFPYAVATTASGYDLQILGGDEPSNGAGSNRGGAAAYLLLTAPLQLPPIQGGKIRSGAITLAPGLVIDTCEMCDIDFSGAQIVYNGSTPGEVALRLKPTQVTPLDPNFGISPSRIFSTTVVGRTRLDLSGHANANVDYTDLHIVEMNWVTLTGGCAVLVDSPAAGQNMNNNKFNIEQLHGSGAVTTAFCHGTAAAGGGAILGGSYFNIGLALDSAGATNGFDEWGSNDEIHLHVAGLSTGYALKFELGACKNVAWIWTTSGTATVTDSSGCTGTSANIWYINGTMFVGGASIASNSADVVMANGGLFLGTQSSKQGFLVLNWGSGAAGAVITSAANGGSPILQTPNTNGTLVSNVTAPIVLNGTTGNASCPTCVTSSGGGAISGTAPIAVSAGGVVSINAPYASLTASNGGIVYSGATNLAILNGTATARQMLQSGASTTPAWSTTTWPATSTVNRILYSSSANVIGEITTANSSILVTDSGGIPSLSTTVPAFTLGGTLSGGGNQINNVIIGTTTPLAGLFTTLNSSSLTASSAVATDGSKNLVSVANTGTGSNVLATSPVLTTPNIGAATATSINFGGTSLANYVEASWTPVVSTDATPGTPAYTTQIGSYERIGRQILVRFNISLSGWTGSPTGNVIITGLPLTSNSGEFAGCVIGAYTVTGLAALNYGINALILNASTTILLRQNGNAGSSPITAAQFGTTAQVYGFCAYRV